jgi:hypothetical protein
MKYKNCKIDTRSFNRVDFESITFYYFLVADMQLSVLCNPLTFVNQCKFTLIYNVYKQMLQHNREHLQLMLKKNHCINSVSILQGKYQKYNITDSFQLQRTQDQVAIIVLLYSCMFRKCFLSQEFQLNFHVLGAKIIQNQLVISTIPNITVQKGRLEVL